MSKRPEVLNRFKRNEKNRDIAFCKLCSKQLGCKGSSTTPLSNHLKIHKIYIYSSDLSATTENSVCCIAFAVSLVWFLFSVAV